MANTLTAAAPSCRACGASLSRTFVDLGMSPLCQTQIHAKDLNHGEIFYPLHAYLCTACWLVQLEEYVSPSVIFSESYPYFSSFSDSWVDHARRYVDQMQREQGIGPNSFVVELASNDGYLLQHFVAAGVRCLGVEPTAGTAQAAIGKGIPTEVKFFGTALAERLRAEKGAADLVLGNNVLAHVPDLNDFVGGVARLLGPQGFCTFEFPHLMRLMEFNQFDTIYHEHFSYFSLTAVSAVLARHGLTMFDVEELPTHGGSLRIYAQLAVSGRRALTPRVAGLIDREESEGVRDLATYDRFQGRVHATKRGLLRFLIGAREASKTVVGYGAPGKGNTLLNYCGIGTDFLSYTVDRNPVKKGTWTPGTRIPILDPDEIARTRPDYVLILPWNLREEIERKMAFVREWGGKFVVPIPAVEIS
ncbi:MAG: class I SAM-dependent methyltransferase [Gammaproteobacteria bacterium]|nr:class I SAM-dependent methyltransferase [Gammaproteobacteria bacterium]